MAILNKKFTTQVYEVTYYVEETQHGMRLDQYLQIYLETWSRQEVKKRIKAGDVKIIGRPGKHRPSTTLHYKERIFFKIERTTQEDEYWRGELIELDERPEIIFEDKELIVMNKPPYMACHPTGRHLFYCATVMFEEKYEKTIHSIHRLDRETSGVMMLGKEPQIANLMGEEFIHDRVKKCYFFIAKANEDYKGEIEFFSDERLGASEEGLKRVYIDSYPEDSHEGKHAYTDFKVLFKEGDYVIGLAFPQTGRQHQIRVHAMLRGLPLVGDKLYLGSFEMFQRFKDNLASPEEYDQMEHNRHCLHAIGLKLHYKGEDRMYISSLPKDFIPLIKERFSTPVEEIESTIKNAAKDYFSGSLKPR